MENKYLEKVADWMTERRRLEQEVPSPMSPEEVRDLIVERDIPANLVHTSRDPNKAMEELKAVLPADKQHLASKIVALSMNKGPRVWPAQSSLTEDKALVMGGGTEHTTPILHELGHIMDYSTPLGDLKRDASLLSKKLLKNPITHAAMGGLAMLGGKAGLLGVAAPILVKSPTLRSETAANLNAAALIRDAKGDEAARDYLRDSANAYLSYWKGPLKETAAMGAMYGIGTLLKNRAAKVVLTKKAAWDDIGPLPDKKRKRKPRRLMTPEEQKVLKYKSISARKKKQQASGLANDAEHTVKEYVAGNALNLAFRRK